MLIIEDSEEVVDAVSLAFNIRWPQAVILSTDRGEEGIEMIVKEQPDLVILDLGLPDINGFDVLRRIRLFSSVPVVILTVRGEEADIVKGLELGADEYIVKPFKQLELLSRIKAIHRRQYPVDEETTIACGQFCLYPLERAITFGSKRINLTRTECVILSQLIKNAGNVIPYSLLAERLWGNNYPDAIKGLKVYINRLRKKIEPNCSHPRIILNKPGLGYVFNKIDSQP
jgi:two-component system KDP operon response regulator KdpE